MAKSKTRPKAKGKPPEPKATAAQIAVRVEEILRIRLDGAQFHDVSQYASEKQWGVGERELWRYIERADGLLAQRHETDREKLLARHHAARMTLYSRAVNAADYRTALAILADECRLRGLYPVEKKELDVQAFGVQIVTQIVPNAPDTSDQTVQPVSETG